ncbi:MAG TPA: hypothetical protein VF364_01500 [Candidatus Limnocylindria bacterium]
MISAFRAVWPRWWMWLLAGAIIVMGVHTLVWPSPGLREAAGFGLPETDPFTAAERIGPFLAAIGQAGRGQYMLAQALDLATIGLLGSWLAIGIRNAAALPSGDGYGWLVALPIGAALTDLFEDACLALVAVAFPPLAISSEVLGSVVILKFVLYGATALALLVLGWFALRAPPNPT